MNNAITRKDMTYSDAIEQVMLHNGYCASLKLLYEEIWKYKDISKTTGKTPNNTIQERVQRDKRFTNISRGIYALTDKLNLLDENLTLKPYSTFDTLSELEIDKKNEETDYEKDNQDDFELIVKINDTKFESNGGEFTYSGKPKQKKSIKTSTGKTYYPRDKIVSINALNKANHQCEYNTSCPSFERKTSSCLYTEPHHLIPMSKQNDFNYSLDVEENIISLCSNCHNCMHYGKLELRYKIIEKLYNERKDFLFKVGLEIKLEDLKKYYD